MVTRRSSAIAILAAVACLAPLAARAVSSGSTYAFYSVGGINQVQDSRIGLGEVSQIAYDDFGAQANAFASNSNPFPGLPPALRASASLALDGTHYDSSHQSWAAAVGTYDWLIEDLQDPEATGTILIQGVTTLSGTLVGDFSAASSDVSMIFSFRDPVAGGAAQSVACALSSSAGGAACEGTTSGALQPDLSGLSVTQLSATEWEIMGEVIFDIAVTVNAVNELGGQLTTSVATGLDTPFSGASLFDQTLTLEYRSGNPEIGITLIPEPRTAVLLCLGLLGLAAFRRPRAAGL